VVVCVTHDDAVERPGDTVVRLGVRLGVRVGAGAPVGAVT
jgi:ATP-binding cassette subfamily C protein CydCD